MQPILPRWMLWTLCVMMIGLVFLIRVDRATSKEWWRNKECRFQSLQKPMWTPREEYLTAVCATRKYGVDLGTFVSVGQCESGWNRFANNSGNYLGLFQHAAGSY